MTKLFLKISRFIFSAIFLILLLPCSVYAQKGQPAGPTGLVLTVLPNNYNINLSAGKDNLLALDIKNAGPNKVTNIRISSDKPEGWEINFVPSTISELEVGKNQTVELHIKPDISASRTGYSINILAQANETQQSQTLFVNITEASFWIWIGAAIAVIIIGVFVFIFLRSSRQRA
jgi:uncharacterized membrane protein